MKRILRLATVCGVLSTSASSASLAGELNGKWLLQIDDLDHKPRISATILFTQEPADSCIVGTWKRVVVTSSSSSADRFFPISEPLAYEVRDGSIALGRTTVCDGYLILVGPLGDEAAAGEYNAVSIEYKKHKGYFSMKRSK